MRKGDNKASILLTRKDTKMCSLDLDLSGSRGGIIMNLVGPEIWGEGETTHRHFGFRWPLTHSLVLQILWSNRRASSIQYPPISISISNLQSSSYSVLDHIFECDVDLWLIGCRWRDAPSKGDDASSIRTQKGHRYTFWIWILGPIVGHPVFLYSL